jgi:multicomponent Na+:H+ antiporter subunit A
VDLVAAVLSGFVLAALAPFIHARARRYSNWLLGLLPLGLALYFGLRFGPGLPDETVVVSYGWAAELGVRLSFHVDGLGLLFALLISGIGAIVVIYSGGYLAGDARLGRFHGLILAFMASMLGLVLADNVFTLYVFWELTSITSFMLIGFDHESERSRAAAWQALIVTTAGGLALLAGLVMLGIAGGSFELTELIAAGGLAGHDLYVPILVLVLVGAFTKSAQFPFHFWLPNAMEAPTPVSAYLHSATMVKAGVYLLARFQPILGGTDEWLYGVTLFGAATLAVGAFLALQQTDLKRLLAYSTVAALGALTMLLGIGSEEATAAAIVFLFAHALYKGTLFLVAGAIDHETGTRDSERLGGLRTSMPLTAVIGLLAALSMAGLAPFTGFVGKELLYEAVTHAPILDVALSVVAVGAGVVFVAVALIAGVRPFTGPVMETPKHPHEAPVSMLVGPGLLAGMGLAFGLVSVGVRDWLLEPAASAVQQARIELDLALYHGFTVVLMLSVLSLALGFALYASRRTARRLVSPLAALAADWGVERWYERGIDGLNDAARVQTKLLQSGYLNSYLTIVVVVTTLVVGYTLLAREGLAVLADPLPDLGTIRGTVAALMVLGGLAAALLRSRLGAIAALSVVGYGAALTFVMFGAPDLAMTQVLIETLTLILLILVFYHLPAFERLSSSLERGRDAIIAGAAGLVMTALVLTATASPSERVLTPYFAEAAQPEAHGRNIVNVILVDFRALDTLGEITVLAAAGVGVFALLRLRPRRLRRP